MKRAIITGITGQDGSYLAELLLEKGYEVHGIVRRSSTENFERIAHLADRVSLHQADLLDQLSLIEVLREVRPARGLQPRGHELRADELEAAGPDRRVHRPSASPACWRRSACSTPRASAFTRPAAARCSARCSETPQSETTPFYPRSPYGVAKVYGHWITVNYRESYGMYCCSGILFNHESPRRGREFVTRKVTDGGGADQARAGEGAAAGQPGGPPRLGLRRRLRRGDVADAAAGPARRLRHRHRRDAHRRRAGGGGVRPRRPGLAASTSCRTRRWCGRPRWTC